jgi:hypothetical protein
MSLRKVLVCGDDVELLTTRGLVLAHAGFDVVSACDKAEIGTIPDDSAIALGVVGHPLTENEQSVIAADMKQRWPEIKILFLSKTPLELQTLPSGYYRSSSDEPAHLIEVCKRIVDPN